MTDALEAVLEECWETHETGQATCRWCHGTLPVGHSPGCPCLALDRALRQRDAIAGYSQAEKRNRMLQAALRLAKGPDKADVKRKLQESVLALEEATARLRELGIENMVR